MSRPVPPLPLLVILVMLVMLLAAAPVVASEASGFLYGTVALADGDTLVGFLRWQDEEAFWDDIFQARQRDVPWDVHADMERLHKERQQAYYRTHGLIDRIAYALEHRDPSTDLSRWLVVRFGDIATIAVDAEEKITVTTSDGSVYAVRGRSNDVRQDIEVHAVDGGRTTLEWDEFRLIRFSPVPDGAVPYAERLYGRVRSRAGEFAGFIQWDKSECTTIDVLDSDQEDLAMGEIASLRRLPGGTSEATLHDGRVLALSGSNDVESGHRGVVVQTAGHGRVTIPWDQFQAVEFQGGHGSGPGREDYAGDGPLHGTVVDASGRNWSGRLVYDLDESRRHDLLNGTDGNLAYAIPFALIASIVPGEPGKCQVTLHDGTTLDLAGDQDTGDDHAGVLVWTDPEATPRHLLWGEISVVRLDP